MLAMCGRGMLQNRRANQARPMTTFTSSAIAPMLDLMARLVGAVSFDAASINQCRRIDKLLDWSAAKLRHPTTRLGVAIILHGCSDGDSGVSLWLRKTFPEAPTVPLAAMYAVGIDQSVVPVAVVDMNQEKMRPDVEADMEALVTVDTAWCETSFEFGYEAKCVTDFIFTYTGAIPTTTATTLDPHHRHRHCRRCFVVFNAGHSLPIGLAVNAEAVDADMWRQYLMARATCT